MSATYGGPPVKPPIRTVDVVVSWVLYAGLLAVEALLALFAMFGVMMTDSCGTGTTDARVCDGAYLAGVIFGYWGGLVLLAVAVPVAIVVTTVARRPSWPWAVGALGVLTLMTVLFVTLMTR